MGLFRKSGHAHLMLSAAVGALALGSGAAWAQSKPITIPPQTLASALHDFGSQTGRQIFFAPELTASKVSPGVNGATDEQVALAQILQGTGLTFRRDANAFIIEQEGADPQSGSAAGDGADQGTVQALIVTAQKREENIQDVPIAMSAFTQEALERSQVAGGPDLMTQVPNMTFTKTNFSSYSIQIRGIGTQAISATTDAAVAVAFNNTPFIRNRFFEQEFYDLQRVEVLRGPQGTLYGRNATAGVVNIISAKPKFTYEAKLSADVGNYNSTRFEGMVNVPLVDDKVALRIAGAWTKREGYDTNQITGNQIDGRDLWSTRVSLRFAPTDKINANLIWEHFKEDDDRLRSGKQLCNKDIPAELGGVALSNVWTGIASPMGFLSQGCKPASLYSPDSFQTPNGFALPYYQPLSVIHVPTIFGLDPYLSTTQSSDLRVIESTVDPHYSAETDVVELQFSVDLPDSLTLTSETGYLSDTVFSTQDYNRFNTAPHAFDFNKYNNGVYRPGVLDANGVFCDPQIGCADRLVAVDLSTADSHHFSQEFRLASDYDGPFNFSLGANFLRYDTTEKYYVFINTLTMYAALGSGVYAGPLGPYTAGVTDNHECLRQGYAPPNPTIAYDVLGCVYIDPNPIGSLNDQGHNYFLSKNPYKLISYAAFGEAYYNITPTLKLTAGLRWTVDKKEAPIIPSWVLGAGIDNAQYGASGAGYSVAEVIDQEWREPTGRLAIDWKPDLSVTDETLLYASYAHGYKAGGANPPVAGIVMYGAVNLGAASFSNVAVQRAAVHPKTFDPEFVDAFEIGAKNTLLGGKLILNAGAFYYDYTGYQISEIVDRSALNLNFDARVWGLELESDWRPVENLRLGVKLGYENTRVADGSRAVDLMDRTAGHSDWAVVRPFPTFPSNCVLPVSVLLRNGVFDIPGQPEGGNVSGCELTWVLGLDPITELPYVANPITGKPGSSFSFDPAAWQGYAGFNPDGHPEVNGGAGFFKDLSGNALPNAPHYTATITADYTLPLPSNWLMTLHTDLYYQSEAWTRIFNTPGYDKLKAYTNVNLAAIFSNDDAGWKVMAYVKNVFDRDSITGAFLNSDDTGLTTNVFLTEPRLYGLRVTKEWNGGPWWTGSNPNHPAGEPYPLTVEIGGQVQRQDAPYETLTPSFADAFSPAISPTAVQNRDLDIGDGRELKLVYRPKGSVWTISAGVRYGRTNASNVVHAEESAGPAVCRYLQTVPIGKARCDPQYALPGSPVGAQYRPGALARPVNWSDASATERENHEIVDFAVGRDVGLGFLDDHKSSVGVGLRYASFESASRTATDGIPDWNVPEGWFKYNSTHDRYAATFEANREFKGAGPTLSWEASKRLLGNDEVGGLDIDWSVSGGVLFGRQTTRVSGTEAGAYFKTKYTARAVQQQVGVPTPLDIAPREQSVSVPLVDLSLGLSYETQRVKVSTGYRWERYYNALDAGYAEHKSYDRTFDGPYFKIAVGFGG